MAKIVAYDTPTQGVTLEDLKPHLKEEAKHAWELYKAGIFREIYLRTDRPGALMVMECADVDEARKITEDLPLVKEGLIKFEFIPVGAFMPWETLFAEA